MAILPDDVRRIARLAALRLDDDEVDRLTGELADLLEHFGVLGHAEGAEPAESAEESAEETVLRSDEAGADPLAYPPGGAAPGFEDGLFTVPRVLGRADAEDADAEGAPS